jgi:hypothetical protein
MDRPACPICGTDDAGPPDSFGVHRCSACRIEFRPERRVPIRRATVTLPVAPVNNRRGGIAVLVIVGAMLGLAVAIGDHKASTRVDQFESFTPPPVQLDPAMLEALDGIAGLDPITPFGSITLARELHLSQIAGGELFATGIIYADERFPVEDVIVEVECRDLAGGELSCPRAVVSCKTMQPGDRCAWMIETRVSGSIAEIEFSAHARQALGLGPPQLDLRSDRSDRGEEVELDPKRRELTLKLPNPGVSSAWATVSAYNEHGRVLGVSETRWPALEPGRRTLAVAVPKPPDEVERYEVRVGGELRKPTQ